MAEKNWLEEFEHAAEQFYRETGIMAPGKSVPHEMGASQPDYEERSRLWIEWCRKRVDVHGEA